MNIVAILIWIAIIAVFVFFWVGGKKNKKKYEGRSMEITRDWYEKSQSMYGTDDSRKAWYFEFDKNYLTQGHLMVDRNHQPVYEAKILYGDMIKGYEADFTNHVINYQHHHNLGAVTTIEAGSGHGGVALSSTFRFDGKDIWDYVESLGYSYHFRRTHGLAWQVDVTKAGEAVGTIYSSNGGKNYFGCEGPIEAKMGGNGFYVVECAERDMDALFLLAVAFAKTEFSVQNMK